MIKRLLVCQVFLEELANVSLTHFLFLLCEAGLLLTLEQVTGLVPDVVDTGTGDRVGT